MSVSHTSFHTIFSPSISQYQRPCIQITNSICLMISLISYTLARDVHPQQEIYLPDFSIYHNYSSIQSHLKLLTKNNPNYMKIDWNHRSRENRPQYLFHLTNFTGSRTTTLNSGFTEFTKVKVLFSYGEHAREFFPLESLFGFLKTVFSGLSAPEGSPAELFSRTVLSKFDIFIIGLANPDGRVYVERTQNYCWRGTSTGVDLNRNFDWQFGNLGSSGHPDDEEYRGKYAFSEPETEVFKLITAKYRFDAFFSFHSGIRQIYLPYADTKSKTSNKQPDNFDSMMELAKQMAESTNYDFTYGEGFLLNEYTADGAVFDYMAGVRKIPFSYAIELWGVGDHKDAKCFDLFNPRSTELQKTVQDMIPLYRTLIQYLLQWKEGQIRRALDAEVNSVPLTFGYILLAAVLMVAVLVILQTCQSYLPSYLRLYPRRRVINLRNLSSTFMSLSMMKST